MKKNWSKSIRKKKNSNNKSRKKQIQQKDKNILQDTRKNWSVEEKNAVRKHLSRFFLLKTVPGKKKDCELCID